MPRPTKERRHHVVYITRNTEYHCRDHECVGVRERMSGEWQRDHPALRGKLVGAVQDRRNICKPRRGLRLLFKGGNPVVTSPMVISARPDKKDVFSYTSLCWAGEIGLLG